MLAGGGTIFSLIIFMAAGIFAGAIASVLYLFVKLTNNNFAVVFGADFLSAILGCLIFYVICVKYFYASITLYFIACFAFGIIFEFIFIKNLVANPLKYVYNKLMKKKNKRKEAEHDKNECCEKS